MLNDFYKIGQVIEVRGQKIRIKVFENKNSNILVYKGKIIKNVSVGSFVKIPKGFSNIIGKIEGEYINENKNVSTDADTKFLKESNFIDRIIEVSVMGVLDNEGFKRGLMDIPLVYSDAYILTDEEVQKIFQFCPNINNAICVGSINDYKQEKLYLDINHLLASHIGIFGNTGSGKSNTLAKIYHECFQKFENRPGFSKSKFIIIDFNGEYNNSFTNSKKVYRLSTRKDDGDKIPVPSSFLEDLDMWSIICEATDKTQRPFLNRAISLYKLLKEENLTPGKLIEKLLKSISSILTNIFDDPARLVKQIRRFQEIFTILTLDLNSINIILDNLQARPQSGKTALYIDAPNNEGRWINTINDFNTHVAQPIINAISRNNKSNTFSEYDILELSLKLKFLEEVNKQFINEEHISPLIARFNSRLKKIKKLLNITSEHNDPNVVIYSLLDVNIDFKKLMPLIICKYQYDSHKQQQNVKSLHIIIDEAHNILSTSSERESQTWKDYRLETFEEIIKEGRKFGAFLTIASQRPSDISETIISQLHNYFIHRLVNNEDIRAIGKAVSFIDNNSFEMIPVLPQGACIFTGISSNFPVLVQVDLLPEPFRPQSTTVNLIASWNS